MFFLPFSAKHALYQLRDVTQYILALGGLAVSNPGYVVFIIYDGIFIWIFANTVPPMQGVPVLKISDPNPIFQIAPLPTHPPTTSYCAL